MPQVHALFWFDVEDCQVPECDDATKRIAQILTRYGVRGTMKVVGQKARLLEQRLRYDTIDALQQHDIGYHSNHHGLRPQIAEYLAPLEWDDGVAEFVRRERAGLDDVERLFGRRCSTYGQPGCNWAPQPFQALRAWGIPTYVSGFGYVGCDCQPFWYGGLLCTSHLYGRRLDGSQQGHLMGLNFELGRPGELAKHQAQFSQSLAQLTGTGGLISLLNHPCTLVLQEWFSTAMKPPELIEAGYQHFESFVSWAVTQPHVTTTSSSRLLELYPDQAVGHVFDRDELRAVAAALTSGINFQRLGDLTLSAAEAFGLLVRALAGTGEGLPPVAWQPVYNPRRAPEAVTSDGEVTWPELRASLVGVLPSVERRREVPARVMVGGRLVAPADYLSLLARAVVALIEHGSPPDRMAVRPAPCRFEALVDADAAQAAWGSVMMPPGFAGPNLLALAQLGAWTLKPAILRVGG